MLRKRVGFPGNVAWVALLVVSSVAAPALADSFVCEDEFCVFGAGDVLDNVIVKDGGVLLLLDGTMVTGNIEVEEGGILATTGALIAGNVQADKAPVIDLGLSLIAGNVELKEAGGEDFFGLLPIITVLGCDVAGNVKVEGSDVNIIAIAENTISGNCELTDNLAMGSITIETNVIVGNLKCEGNSPAPTGGDNVVGGNVEGQCAGLVL